MAELKRKPGRPQVGERRNIRLTLEPEAWAWLADTVEHGHAASQSDLLRKIIDDARGRGLDYQEG